MVSRRRVHELIDPGRPGDRASRAVDGLIITFVMLSVVSLLFSLGDGGSDVRTVGLVIFEVAALSVFTAEYVLRLWSCVESPRFSRRGGRLLYAMTPLGIIDLMSIVPLIAVIIIPTGDLTPIGLAIPRAFRIFKLIRYSKALQMMSRVIWKKRRVLAMTYLIIFMILVLSSVLLFTAEHNANPEEFGSAWDAMWWSVITLATVGYGDVVPVTDMGRFLGSIIALIGVGMFAFPAGILASGFMEEMGNVEDDARIAKVERLHSLREVGALTDEEFEAEKARVLDG